MNKISVIIPILNERGNVELLIKRLRDTLQALPNYELIFIDDHSTDGTLEFLKSIHGTTLKVFLKTGKKGKAYSLIEGFQKSSGQILGMIDADLQYPPEALPLMIDLINNGQKDVVVGRRVQKKISFIRRLLSDLFAFLFARVLHGLNLDVQSGLKVFRREVFESVSLKPNPWTFDLEFLVKASDQGFKIGSVPVTFSERYSGQSKVGFVKVGVELLIASIKLKFDRFGSKARAW